MTSAVFYFQVHQPYRLRSFRARDVGGQRGWFDDRENRRILRRVAERCYLPMNRLLLDAIERTDGRFRCSFSLSGTVLSQLEDWAPRALKSFVALAETGAVEFLAETSHHSLAALADLDEWEAQVEDQRARVEELFGQRPTTFRNTELILSDEIARRVEALGFDALLGEGTALARIARAFRSLPCPVVGRIHDGAFVLDLRCLEDEKRFIDQLSRLELTS